MPFGADTPCDARGTAGASGIPVSGPARSLTLSHDGPLLPLRAEETNAAVIVARMAGDLLSRSGWLYAQSLPNLAREEEEPVDHLLRRGWTIDQVEIHGRAALVRAMDEARNRGTAPDVEEAITARLSAWLDKMGEAAAACIIVIGGGWLTGWASWL